MGVVVAFEDKEAGKAGIEALVGLTRPDMERVNAMILSRTGSQVTMIPEVANHLISSGGKRLRPMLTLATAALCDYEGEGHIKLAASVEFMHTATLLHDDVVDESDMRRGKLAARMLWGNEASVLVGDFLLGQAFKMMVEVGSLRALDILSTAAAVIAEGEVMQLAAAKNTETTEDEYLAVIRGKTAELFAAACEVGPVIAGSPKAGAAACRSYGLNLGIAFQLIDDALDYGGSSGALGKNTGDDFREGKITLPVVLSFRRGDEEERAFWRRTLQEGQINEGDFAQAQALMRKHKAIEDTVERARHYAKMAKDALGLYPQSPMKQALNDAVDFCVARPLNEASGKPSGEAQEQPAEITALSSRVVYENRWMRVREDEVLRQDGSTGIYGVVEKTDFVAIVAVEENGDLHLVEQYRYPVGGRFWELPQGSWESRPDAEPVTVARGELREEAGVEAGEMIEAGYLFECYGYSNQGCHVFLARQLSAATRQLDHEEQGLVTRRFSPAEVTAMIESGAIRDAITIAALGLMILKGLLPDFGTSRA